MIVELSKNEPTLLHVRIIECLLREWIVFCLIFTIFNFDVTILIAVVFLFVLIAMLHVDISHICVFLVFIVNGVRSILVAILSSILLINRHSDAVIFARFVRFILSSDAHADFVKLFLIFFLIVVHVI